MWYELAPCSIESSEYKEWIRFKEDFTKLLTNNFKLHKTLMQTTERKLGGISMADGHTPDYVFFCLRTLSIARRMLENSSMNAAAAFAGRYETAADGAPLAVSAFDFMLAQLDTLTEYSIHPKYFSRYDKFYEALKTKDFYTAKMEFL